ncbi:MAG: hypothetical protein FVQ82_06055 [Planctomycetes bacterium]|nr:hypothetical protein [Planctomycetota bacterium]
MSVNYSPITFIRSINKKHLRQYFTKRKLLDSIDWSLEGEEYAQALYEKIKDSNAAVRDVIAQDFGIVSSLATVEGVISLYEIISDTFSKDKADAIREKLDKIDGLYDKVLLVLLNNPKVIEWVLRLEHMEKMKFKHDCFVGTDIDFEVDDETIEKLKEEIQKYYKSQGRGQNCHIDHYIKQNPERYCFFAYPEDYAKRDLTYKGSQLTPYVRRPVMEIVFVYDATTGILKLSAGRMRNVDVMQNAFCKKVLGLPGLPDGSTKVYKLAPLLDPNFRFVTDPKDKIESVSLRILKVKVNKDGEHRKLTCEGEPLNPGTDLLRDMVTKAIISYALSPKRITVLQAKITIRFKPEKGKASLTATFWLYSSGGSAFENKPTHHIAERCVHEWGLVGFLISKDGKTA